MLRHVVVFGIKETEGNSSRTNALMLKQELLKLKDVIPFLIAIEVGVNAKDAPDDNSELCLICDFESIDDAAMYQIHPEHVKVAKIIGQYKTSRACVDYEI